MRMGIAGLAGACLLAVAPCQAAEVTVLSGGAVRSALSPAAASWEAASGNKVATVFAPAGEARKKIAAGEKFDIIVIAAENLPALEKEGAIDPATRRDLGAVAMGAAVKQGERVPDISTPEKLKSALLAAKSVTYMDPTRGTSGKHFDEEVLPKLGVRDAVRAKAKLGESGNIAESVANGEVEIAFHQMTEILPVKGITVVGLLPAELQKTTVYSGAVSRGARNPREAQALLDYLAAPAGRKYFLDRGFTAP